MRSNGKINFLGKLPVEENWIIENSSKLKWKYFFTTINIRFFFTFPYPHTAHKKKIVSISLSLHLFSRKGKLKMHKNWSRWLRKLWIEPFNVPCAVDEAGFRLKVTQLNSFPLFVHPWRLAILFTHRKRKKLFEKSFAKKIYLKRNYSDFPWEWTLIDTIDNFWVQLMFVNTFSWCIFIVKQKKSFNFLRTAKNYYFFSLRNLTQISNDLTSIWQFCCVLWALGIVTFDAFHRRITLFFPLAKCFDELHNKID